MFIRQAIAQYKIFIGDEPDEQIIRQTITARLK
jgi:shikimate 5-dehydrogenase